MCSKIPCLDSETRGSKSGLPWKIQCLLWYSGWGCVVGSNFTCEFQATTGGWGPGRTWLLHRDKDRPCARRSPSQPAPTASQFLWGTHEDQGRKDLLPPPSPLPRLHPVSPQPLKGVKPWFVLSSQLTVYLKCPAGHSSRCADEEMEDLGK